MIRTRRACLWAGVLSLALSACALGVDPPVRKSPAGKDAPAADGSIKIKLQWVSLSSPGWMMTPTDGARPNLKNGVVVPQLVAVTPEKTADVSIGGVPATLVFNGRDCGIKNEFSQFVLQPNRTRDAFMPVTLKIAKDKSYQVAFPTATIALPKSCALAVRPGFAMRGQANGVSVLLYDDNMDGRFTLGKDAIRIGDSASGVGVFAPTAKYIATPAGLYEVRELAEDGSSITLAKADEKAGKLQIAYPSDSVEIHAAFSSNDASFVAVANPRVSPTFAVAPGKYEFRYGLAYSPGLGKLVAAVKAAGSESIDVSADKPAKIALGGPYKFDFRATLAGGKININPGSIRLMGKNGEQYEDFKWLSAPEVGMMSDGQIAMLGRMSFS